MNRSEAMEQATIIAQELGPDWEPGVRSSATVGFTFSATHKNRLWQVSGFPFGPDGYPSSLLVGTEIKYYGQMICKEAHCVGDPSPTPLGALENVKAEIHRRVRSYNNLLDGIGTVLPKQEFG